MTRNRMLAILLSGLLGLGAVACDAEVETPEGGVQVEGEEGGEGEGGD